MQRQALLGRNGQNQGAQLGAQFDEGQKVFFESDPDKWRRVVLPLPAVTLSSGATDSSVAQPQDPFQVVWLTIPPALRIIPGSSTVSASYPAVQVDDSNDFTVEAITVGTRLQLLEEGPLPIAMFAPASQVPDLVLDGGETSKFFRVNLKNNGTQTHTIRPAAVALRAMG